MVFKFWIKIVWAKFFNHKSRIHKFSIRLKMSIKLNRKYQNVWCMKMCWKPLRLASRIFLHFPQSSANRCQILLSKNSYFNRFKDSKPDETATWLHWNRPNYATPKSLRKVWEKNVYSAHACEFINLDAHFYTYNSRSFSRRQVFWSVQLLTQGTVSGHVTIVTLYR